MTRNKLDDARVPNIERILRSGHAIKYLDFIRKKYGEDKCIEDLKHAGFFVTDRYNSGFSDIRMSEITTWVRWKCGIKAKIKFSKYRKEGKKLSAKKALIESDIRRLIDAINDEKGNALQVLEWVNTYIRTSKGTVPESIMEGDQADITRENMVFALGFLIRMGLLSENADGNTNIPDKVIESLIHYGLYYFMLNDLITNWMFGDVRLKKKMFGPLILEEQQGIIADRIISFNEYNSLNEAKLRKIQDKYSAYNDEILVYEKALRDKVTEFLYSKQYTEIFADISLDEWIKLYTFFRDLVQGKRDIISIEKPKLISLMSNASFNIKTIEKAIELFSSNEKSDLFSNWLIEHKGGYILIPSVIDFTEPLKSMINLLNNTENSGIGEKGIAFENHINDLISVLPANYVVEKNLKTTDQGETYELDILIHLDNTLFILECKTQFQHENVRDYYRNLSEVDYYLNKFKRNVNYFTTDEKGKEKLNNKFRSRIPTFDIDKTDTVLVFVSNITYPFVEKDGIHFIDEIKMFNFFKHTSPKVNYYVGTGNIMYRIPIMREELFNAAINDDTFKHFLSISRNYEIDPYSPIEVMELNTLMRYEIIARRLVYNSDLQVAEIEKYIERLKSQGNLDEYAYIIR